MPATRRSGPQKRVFGIVHFEQDPPVFGDVEKLVGTGGRSEGSCATVQVTYQFILDKLGEQARTIIAKLKAKKVTTVIFLGDPIMPINLTTTATQQNYFPEWIITGTVLTDTTHARPALRPEAVVACVRSRAAWVCPPDQKHAEAWRMHKWYFGTDPVASKTVPLIYHDHPAVHARRAHGRSRAQPDDVPRRHVQVPGERRRPGVGPGQLRQPRRVRRRRQIGFKAKPDYLAVDDMAEIWWDPKAKGPDEQGKDGVGLVTFANGGRRYIPGKMPEPGS